VFILSHTDADGILSAYLVSKLEPEAQVVFQDWNAFGFHEKDVKRFKKAKKLYILDLGSDEKTLRLAHEIEGQTVIIDHHNSSKELIAQYMTPDHTILWDTNNCTTGLVYRYAEFNELPIDKWFKIWTVIGIYADVATELSDAQALLQELRNSGDVPWVFWNYVYWMPEKKYENMMPLPAIWGRYINTPRRLTWGKGAYVVLRALQEIEIADDITLLEDPFGKPKSRELDADFPNLALVRYWYREWVEKRDQMFSEEWTKTFDFPTFRLSITKFPWDVAGWIASVKATEQKPAFCIHINTPDSSIYAISARSRGQDLLKYAELLMARFGDKITLGGHKEALGGSIKAMPIEQLIAEFEKALAPETTLMAQAESIQPEVSSDS
jgi:hypothetical protein